MSKKRLIAILLIVFILIFSTFRIVDAMNTHLDSIANNVSTSIQSTTQETTQATENSNETTTYIEEITSANIPAYSGNAFVALNNNYPVFDNYNNTSIFETYSELDKLGRCGIAYANICKELMPTEDRETISSVKPSGWTYNGKSNNNKYSKDLVDGCYIYNRCHLIGFQLAGENANEKNLVTGTRYLNVESMLPFENMIADYVKETDNHVLYRVTPKYEGNNLVCNGIQLEAYSVEDEGDGICFNVYCFNVQPGIEINYLTGQNWLATETSTKASTTNTTSKTTTQSKQYVINESSKKFHTPTCSSVKQISSDNKLVLVADKNTLIKQGYSPCGNCNP